MATRVALPPPVERDTQCLAPKMSIAAQAAVIECNGQGWDAILYETCRSAELQQYYFDHGASKAQTIEHSWHGYGLAVDVVSRQHGWDLWGRSIPTAWETNVTRIFLSHGLKWGGDWPTFHDYPHYQWGPCKRSPSDIAVTLLRTSGRAAVWRAVGAD